MDNGNTVQQWNDWCGYFERLHSAKIIIEEDPGLKITIY